MKTEETILVSVTAGDIKAGKACVATKCPIAIALQRETKRYWTVGPRGACSVSRGSGKFLRFPSSAIMFIDRFDKKGMKAVKPFRFSVKVRKTW